MIKKQILTLSIAAIILLSLGGVAAAAVMTPTRDMPAQVVKGQDFDVYVYFTTDEDLTNAIGLADNANNTAGMTATVDKTWCTPNADVAYNEEVYRANYVWAFDTYSLGESFVAKYSVHVPDGTAPGTYAFDGTLEYYVGSTHQPPVDVGGDTEIEVIEGIPIDGNVREVNCLILPGATVELFKDATRIDTDTTDVNGNYSLLAPGIDDFTVKVSKTGYVSETQDILITAVQGEYTLDFVSNDALVPENPNMSYVLECINHWTVPPTEEECQIDMSKVLAVINAWVT